MNNEHWACAACKIDTSQRVCISEDGVSPAVCPTENASELINTASEQYKEPEFRRFAKEASLQEKAGYTYSEGQIQASKSRLQEVVEFARRNNYKRLGIAFCAGLINEARAMGDLLEHLGFEVVSAICKVGQIEKESIGLNDEDKLSPGGHETMCNPVAQAELMNKSKTDFNIVMGLCVGHDSIFMKNAEAYTTVFAVKDRLLGHNPLAAIYTLESYSKYLKKI